ncbi:MAG: SDR family NAD(P)-dependent oxidoreductase, partial [Acidobacteria bacterium]|nr:SDR family NAD(P)-dependent oxidoreductase [Acidobacteriota bacterium]
AALVICRRSELLQRISGRGAMAVVGLSLDGARGVVAPFAGRLSVAVSNSAESTVLSGDPDALDQLLPALESREVFCRRVNVDVASHSPQVEPLLAPLGEAIAGLHPSPARVPFVSTVTGRLHEGTDLGPAYWQRNLREPVLFSTGVQHLVETGHDAFVEMSPHPVLLAPIQQEARRLAASVAAVPSLRREEDERATILESLGRFWVAGSTVDWARVFPVPRRVLAMPGYPWQRERAWFDRPETSAGERQPTAARLLAAGPTRSSLHAGTSFWETDLSLDRLPELADHRLLGRVVLPAACLAELASEALAEAFGAPAALEDVKLDRFLTLPPDATTTVQVAVTQEGGARASFAVSSRDAGAPPESGWTLHASGRGAPAREDAPGAATRCGGPWRHLPASEDAERHYQSMAAKGLDYGPSFMALSDVRRAGHGDRVVARLVRPEALPSGDGWKARSVLFDAALQAVLAALDLLPAARRHHGTFVPVALGRLTSLSGLDGAGELWVELEPKMVSAAEVAADLTVFDNEGRERLRSSGVVFRRLTSDGSHEPGELFYEIGWEAAPLAGRAGAQGTEERIGHWIVFEDGQGVADVLVPRLEAGGARGLRVARADGGAPPGRMVVDPERPGDFDRVLAHAAAAAAGSRLGVVYLWTLDVQKPGDGTGWLDGAETFSVMAPLRLLQAMARAGLEGARLWIVTAGAQACAGDDRCSGLGASPAWGLASAVAAESPSLQCTVVDLASARPAEDAARLAEELLSGSPETRVALRAGTRLVSRLLRRPPSAAERNTFVTQVPGGRPFRAEIETPGILDSLACRERERTAPREGEVEIEVRAAGLNFMNVLSAMGLCPGYDRGTGPLGIECSGVVTRVGPNVTTIAAGDEVMGVAFDCLASHAVTDARLLAPKPPALPFEQAAAVPIAFMTAHYALNHLGRMERGERLLVHSAAGGVGLAAVQLARAAGVEVLATAGTTAKREWLRSLGATFTADSHALGFADEVMEFTGGEGVDLVLNSLAGPAIERGLETLRAHGRFLEIGKRDIYANSRVGLLPFRKNLAYFAIDLDAVCRQRPDLGGRLLAEVAALLGRGIVEPLPIRLFPVTATADAFREMAQGGHTGKLVIAMSAEQLPLRPARAASGGTWLVTGGLGALGLAVAEALAARGVRSLVLVGRSAPGAGARAAIDALERQGVRVTVRAGDVSRLGDVRAALSAVPADHPLDGVVHAAGVLDDALLQDQDEARITRVLKPKIRGAWNLHLATSERPPRHFVLFSSVAAFLGLAGQSNYAAGNAFLDALAAARQGAGLPATSIAWGPWAEVGLAAARSDRGERLGARGLGSVTVEQGLRAFFEALDAAPPHAAVMAFDPSRWREATPASAPFLSRLAAHDSDSPRRGAAGLRGELMALPAAGRLGALEKHVCERVGQVLRLAPSRVDRGRPFRALGLDSLMAVELRNRLEASTGEKLPATLAWNYPTVSVLAPFLAERMGVPLADESAAAPEISGAGPALEVEGLIEEIASLSDDEVRRLLAEE